jgi:hypothetical protein
MTIEWTIFWFSLLKWTAVILFSLELIYEVTLGSMSSNDQKMEIYMKKHHPGIYYKLPYLGFRKYSFDKGSNTEKAT